MSSAQWDKLDQGKVPAGEQVDTFVNTAVWTGFCRYLEERYGVKPVYEYSRCSAVPGWNLKYRKSGRSLCTLYPMQGYFVALVVIGERGKAVFDLLLPTLTLYTRNLYETTKDKNGLCWLMFEMKDETILEDAKQCISLRAGR